jgi:alpha-D-ribose 1-methylphosphonate 5-triphosphate synthase subunit PhnH
MTQAHAMQPLASGLADPVFGSQIVFRTVLDALSAPGIIFDLSDRLAGAPTNLPKAAAALLLTLADYETPVWLSGEHQEARRWLSFHTGAPKAATPSEARFAVIRGTASSERLSDFNLGEDRYPDTSTTILVLCDALEGGLPVTLTGPGIQGSMRFAPKGLAASLWRDIADNNAMYPLGVDLIFVSGSQLAGLPRSTQIEGAF